MATSKRLSAHREAARAAAETPPDDNEIPTPAAPGDEDRETPPEPQSKKKERPMDDETKAAIEAARTEAHDMGVKSANERMNKVFASEHYAGREAAATKLLGKPSLSAEDVIDLLADMPKATPTAASTLTEEQQRAAAEEAGRKEMQAALDATNNSDIDTGAGVPKPDAKKAADDVWAKAYGIKEGVK